jgi:uncharacterized protein (TIGR02145 family)
MNKYLFLIIFLVYTLQNIAQTVTDIDNNIYNTITIGTQTWMKENLKTTKYSDGSAIPEIKDSSVWGVQPTPAYCWYNNDSSIYKNTYGALYNWYAAANNNLCPVGWHVPSDNEWTTLTNFLGGENVAGSMLKEAGNVHWIFDNTDATNSSLFTALPGGFRDYYTGIYNFGQFYYLTSFGFWWTATSYNNNSGYARNMFNNEIYVYREFCSKNYGYSVRCLKDINTSLNILGLPAEVGFYPNPAFDKLYIKHSKSLNPLVIIYDLQGKEVYNKQIDSNPIDISNLSKGIYLVKIVDSVNIVINKMVKE